MKKIILISLVLLCSLSTTGFAKGSSFSWSYFKLSAGAEYFSNLSKRGATFYESFQVIPVFAITLFHPDFQIVGTSLNYKYRFDDNFLWRTRFNINSTGDSPLYITGGEQKTARNERQSTHEWDNYLEAGIPGYGELTLQVSKDFSGHNGVYLDLKARAIIFNFKVGKLTYHPAVFGSIGVGDLKHNSYFYGLGADSFGANNYTAGISIAADPNIDHFYPVFEAKYYKLLGNGNRNAPLVVSKQDGFRVILLMAFNIWDSTK